MEWSGEREEGGTGRRHPSVLADMKYWIKHWAEWSETHARWPKLEQVGKATSEFFCASSNPWTPWSYPENLEAIVAGATMRGS